ncbi:MAG: hypothetical protein NVS4B12_04830 [Ktedonobacteraceae bacterium]
MRLANFPTALKQDRQGAYKHSRHGDVLSHIAPLSLDNPEFLYTTIIVMQSILELLGFVNCI